MKIFSAEYGFLCLLIVFFSCTGQAKDLIWKEDFNNTVVSGGKEIPVAWYNRPGKWLSPATDFFIEKIDGKNVLKVHADKATGAFMYNLSGIVDLKKTPVLRWRWKALKLPGGADGRGNKDDQAVAIYIGTGTLSYRAVAYRWETETPKGVEDSISYGTAKIKWFCIRNKTDSLNEWYTEEKNIAEDFRKIYGFIPEKFIISIAGNSQYTESNTEALVDWIEFVPSAPELSFKN